MRYVVTVEDPSRRLGGAHGAELPVELEEREGGRFRVRVDGEEYDVGWSRMLGRSHWILDAPDARHHVSIEPVAGGLSGGPAAGALSITLGSDQIDLRVRAGPLLPRRSPAPEGGERLVEVRSPMPGLLVSIEVIAGAAVGAGEPLAIVEAMKMQMEVRAPSAGMIQEVKVSAGREVAGGEVLVTMITGAGVRPHV